MATLDLSVVIPAYLEEENLRVVLPRLFEVLSGTRLSYEVLIVDSESPLDNTRAVCDSTGATYIARTGGNNYGDAVRSGLGRATGTHILFMDADGSHSPEFIPRLLAFRDSQDVVIASRYVAGGATENPASLIWMSRILNWVYAVTLNLPCQDVSNSFKLYRAELIQGMRLDCRHFDIVEEILVKCAVLRKDLRIQEVPFVFKTRMFGTTKRDLFLFILTFGVTLCRLLGIRFKASWRR